MIEEFLTGEEVSFIVLSDGVNVVPLEPTQDHKTVQMAIPARTPAAWAHIATAGY